MEENNYIYDLLETIETRSDFEKFLRELKNNYITYKSHVWENDNLESFLEALHGYNYNTTNDAPSWKIFAKILLAARVYE